MIKYNDFYITQQGDIKVSPLQSDNDPIIQSYMDKYPGKRIACSLTPNDVPVSIYEVANSLDDLRDIVKEINPVYSLYSDHPFKQFSIKKDKDDVTKAVKIYYNIEDNNNIIKPILCADTIFKSYFEHEEYVIVDDIRYLENKYGVKIQQYTERIPYLFSIPTIYDSSAIKDEFNRRFKSYYVNEIFFKAFNKNMINIYKNTYMGGMF